MFLELLFLAFQTSSSSAGRVSLQGNEISRQALMASFGAGEPTLDLRFFMLDLTQQNVGLTSGMIMISRPGTNGELLKP